MDDQDAAINDVRRTVTNLISQLIRNGISPEICATGTAAAAALVYAAAMGGIKKGKEADAKELFGSWFVDMIIGANCEEWSAAFHSLKERGNG